MPKKPFPKSDPQPAPPTAPAVPIEATPAEASADANKASFTQNQTFNFHVAPVGSNTPKSGAVEQADGTIVVTGEMAELLKRMAALPDDAAKDQALAMLGEGDNIWHRVLIASLYKQAVEMSEKGHDELSPIGGRHVATEIKEWVRKEYIRKLGQSV